MHIGIKTIILKVFTEEGNLRSAFRFPLPAGILFTRRKKNRAWSYIVDSRGRDENLIWYWILFCLTLNNKLLVIYMMNLIYLLAFFVETNN